MANKVFNDMTKKYTSTLQSALQAEYNNNNNVGEVQLFQGMIDYFENRPQCTAIKTHQHYVEYSNPVVRCEISDILFVSYSRHFPWMKINFLQAKKADFKSTKEGLILNNTKLKFGIAKNQYDLLKNRPQINPLQTGLPKDILNSACNSSITSYGVFYNNPTRGNAVNVEFAFEITDLLHPTPKVTSACFGTIDTLYGCICNCKTYHHPLCCYCYPYHPWERRNLLTTIDTSTFEDALFNFQIGSFVDNRTAVVLSTAICELLKKEGKTNHSFAQFVETNRKYWSRISKDDNSRESITANLESLSLSTKYVVLVDVDNQEDRIND